MIAEPLHPLQAALVARLKTAPPLLELVAGRVFDRWPLVADYPALAVAVGDQSVALEESDECGEGTECFLQIQAFARDEAVPGMANVKAIVGEVRDALRGWQPAIAGHVVAATEYRDAVYFRDDGLTSRGVVTFRVVTYRSG